MIKLAALAGLVLSCGMLGLLKAETLKERIFLLEDFERMILDLRSQMNYFRNPLVEIFKNTEKKGHTAAFSLIGETVQALEEKEGEISQIWAQKVEKLYRATPLTAEDREVLASLGTFIGQSDCENQQIGFQWLENQLHRQMEEARNIYGQKGPMYRRIGFFAGILAGLVLL